MYLFNVLWQMGSSHVFWQLAACDKLLVSNCLTHFALCVASLPLQVAACVAGMFELKDFAAFKHHLRDFLVQTKQFASAVSVLFSLSCRTYGDVRDTNVVQEGRWDML